MKILPVSEYSKIDDLFTKNTANHNMLIAALNGFSPSTCYVDNLNNPQQAFIRLNFSVAFTSKDISPIFLSEVIDALGGNSTLLVINGLNVPCQFPAFKKIIVRIAYSEINFDVLNDIPNQKDCEVRQLDPLLFSKCQWRDIAVLAFGSEELALQNGLIFVAIQKDKIICEAPALFWSQSEVEIGAITHPDYYGMGFASSVCKKLIEECKYRGFEACWTCDKSNLASQALAKKLGYKNPREYAFLEY